jgi:hypothetical protein
MRFQTEMRSKGEEGNSSSYCFSTSGAICAMDGNRNCSVCDCADTSATHFVEDPLCVNHFVARCYETLERLDPGGRGGARNFADTGGLRFFVEECSRRAVDVCLRTRGLTNLQRAQLLDILLWTGDLFLLLRASRFYNPEKLRSESDAMFYRQTAH